MKVLEYFPDLQILVRPIDSNSKSIILPCKPSAVCCQHSQLSAANVLNNPLTKKIYEERRIRIMEVKIEYLMFMV